MMLKYLASAWRNIDIFSMFAELPKQHTTSPYSCIMQIISLVASAVQSVNKETCRGTLSTFSICGRMFSVPLGNLAYSKLEYQSHK